ncbi:MAG: cellulose 1,4-beta-cellobiosidase, partial [Ruminococcus sp.]|nr:cellulose 1,4-beta-cellobiosidase [Ruminococcus sp.]
ISDAVLIMQSIANPDQYKLSAQGKLNADVVDNGGGITNSDALAIQYVEAKTITNEAFPMTATELDALDS